MRSQLQLCLIFTSVCLIALTWASNHSPGQGRTATGRTGTPRKEPARLLVHKQLLNKLFVENMDVVIKYSVFNVGAAAANNVHLKDQNFGQEFEVVGGQAEVTLGKIPPQTNVTHTLVVRPIKFGYCNFTAAQISYTSEGSQEVLQGWSTEPGEVKIASFKGFDKKFSPRLFDWTVFAIMSVVLIYVPFLLWHISKTKYEDVLLSKKTK